MMETRSKRIFLSAVIPFFGMVLTERLGGLALSPTGWSSSLRELISFLLASVVCLILFSLTDRRFGEKDGQLTTRGLASCLLHGAVAVSTLILLQFLLRLANLDRSASGADVFSAISILAIHPVAEEYLFRRRIYRRLRQMDRVFAVVAQAVMCALVQNSVNAMLFAFVGGIALGIVMEKTGRFAVPLLAHEAAAVRFWFSVTDPSGSVWAVADLIALIVGSLSLLVLGVWRLRRTVRSIETSEMKEGRNDG